MKPSVLKNLLFSSLAFGLLVGFIFPFFADFFVVWKPGLYGWFFASALAAGALVGAANFWLVNYILVSPLRRIAEVATEISERNLTHSCHMESDDTVGEIIEAFNKMAGNLRSLINDMGDMSGHVEQDTRNIQKLIDDVRLQLSNQLQSAQQIASSMGRFSSTVNDISSTVEQGATSARLVVDAARSGTSVVAETVSGMNNIQQAVSHASSEIHQLGERSDEIGAIVAVIRSIADQTNLLALNAAIEAARAGEQGRGFAVVADEVRKLAEKTGSATEEISRMIGAVQSQVKQTVLSMAQNQSQVQAGVICAGKAGEALDQILSGIENVSAMMQQIAVSAAEQHTVASEIGRRTGDIESGIGSALAHTQSCDHSCRNLTEQSSLLHQEVRRFRTA
jgi:methyl-accepting chemotaxis protein